MIFRNASAPLFYPGCPINWQAPLNWGLAAWWKAFPSTAGRQLPDLTGRYPAFFDAGFGDSSTTSGFGACARAGAWTELRCDGLDDGLTVANVLDAGSNMTVAAWIRRTNTLERHEVISKESTTGVGGWELSVLSNDLVEFGVFTNDYNLARSTTTLTSLTQYYHLCGVRDAAAGLITLYVNGVAEGTGGAGSPPSPGADVLRIATAPAGGRNFGGAIEEIRVSMRASTAKEVSMLYRASLLGYPQELLRPAWPSAWMPSVGRATKNTRSMMLGMLHGTERQLGIGRLG
jgi:hypothetical protein